MRPPEGFIREEFKAADSAAWQEVVVENVYQLPDDMKGQTVVDVGAHIGCFYYTALAQRGADRVFSFEADARNYAQARRNLDPLHVNGSANVTHGAVFRSDQPGGIVTLASFPEHEFTNTGGGSVVEMQEGAPLVPVTAIPLASILEPLERVDLLKLDCEGAEFPILFTSGPALSKVNAIAAELHPGMNWAPWATVLGRVNTPQELAGYLSALGFAVMVVPQKLANRPLLFAVRK